MADTPSLPKRGLGKGLNALIKTPSSFGKPAPSEGTPIPPSVENPQVTPAAAPVANSESSNARKVRLDQIVPSPFQPRKRFNEEHLNELADSIREHGLIQPLVTRLVDGKYELIAGERRWRACSKLQMQEVPVVTLEATDQEVLAMAVIENLQREDLDPIEQAEAYRRLSIEFGLTQEEIAKHVGKPRSTISNTLRMLDLDKDVQTLVSQKHLSAGHAKALLGVKSRPEQAMLADVVIRKSMSVRDTEAMVQEHVHGKSSATKTKPPEAQIPEKEDAYLKFIEDKLRSRYSTNIVLSHKEKKGKIEIEYYGNDDLSRVLGLMGIDLD